MRLLQRVTNTRMPCRKHLLSLPLQLRPIELHLHQLVHVLHDQHIAIELHNTVVLDQTKGCEFGPAVVEARVGAVVLAALGQQVLDALRGDAAGSQCSMSFGGEGVGVEGY